MSASKVASLPSLVTSAASMSEESGGIAGHLEPMLLEHPRQPLVHQAPVADDARNEGRVRRHPPDALVHPVLREVVPRFGAVFVNPGMLRVIRHEIVEAP